MAESERYLRLLGIQGTPAGLAGLREIAQKHLCRVPFENVSKLLLFGREGAGRVTTISEFLDGIENHDLCGTCYTNNPYLAGLLQALGYDADLLGADMSNPDVHTVIRVRIGGVAWHVDVGFAAPFREPIRLDQLPYEVAHGNECYVLDGDEMSVYSGGERQYGYRMHGPPRKTEFFRPVVLASYNRSQTFMNCLRITRFFEEHTVEVRNRKLFRYRGSESRYTTLSSLAELRSAVAAELAMPRCPVEKAIAVLEQVTGKPFFEE